MRDPGLFGPDSMAWRLCRERSVALMAPRAVILQHAHPTFAAASGAYTGTGRFQRAATTLSEMVFADTETVRAHARRVARIHARVPGAMEPDALSWVLVTLLDATLRGAELVSGRCTDAEVERFLAEGVRFGRLFGVRPRDIPRTRAALQRRIDDAVGDTLVVGPETRALWSDLTSGRWGPMVGAWVGSTLPRRIAEELGAPRTRLLRRVPLTPLAWIPDRWRTLARPPV